ncbi:hypothetical protein D3C75_940140 [compost metagenome]
MDSAYRLAFIQHMERPVVEPERIRGAFVRPQHHRQPVLQIEACRQLKILMHIRIKLKAIMHLLGMGAAQIQPLEQRRIHG